MNRLVIANRGEIARRVLRSARERGYRIAVISTPTDSDSIVRMEADDVLEVDSFLDSRAIVAAAKKWGANHLHPGYGFLSENASFAAGVERAGIRFVGPTPESMRALGNKERAKRLAAKHDVPTLPAVLSSQLRGLSTRVLGERLREKAIEPPFLVKAAGGGGGRGMRVVPSPAELPDALRRASEEAEAGFSDPTVFVERFLASPRHIEIQVFGDGDGGGVALFERECSMQRRYQKLIEEAPSTVVDHELRKAISAAALRLVSAAKYRGAGTVEFLLDQDGAFYFLEVNTRLQVEHPVTEIVYGVDLVSAQLELSEGHWPHELPAPGGAIDEVLERIPMPSRWAVEARVLAEDPRRDFLPTPGPIYRYREPTGVGIRVDSGVDEGGRVHASFDSLIAKVIASGDTRAEAIERLSAGLEQMVVHGATTNLPFLQALVRHPDFRNGRYSTGWISEHIAELTESLLPTELEVRLGTRGFRERLSFALEGAEWAESPFASRFRSLGNEAARVGSSLEQSPIEVRCDPSNGKTVLTGRGLTDALSAFQPSGFRFSPGLIAAHDRAGLDHRAAGARAVATSIDNGRLALTIFGETLDLEDPRTVHRSFEPSRSASSSGGEVRSPMAGRLLELHVQEGDDVDEGQLVAVVESMKMQLEVGAAFAGRVSRLLVAEGDILDGPDVIAEISSVSDSVENPDSSASSNANANAVPIARQLESGARETSPARRRK